MGIGFMWCQNLTTRRGVAEGDWQATMSVGEKGLVILLPGTLLKVLFLFFIFALFRLFFNFYDIAVYG